MMLLLGILLALITPQSLAETISASDCRITYIGRTYTEDGSVSADWTGTTVRIRFKGSVLQAHLSDSRRNRYNVYIDRVPSSDPDALVETQHDTLITLFKGKKGVHEITLIKRTEGEQGRTTFHSFSTNGTFLPATPCRPVLLEFIGDSYACGYGTDGCDSTSYFTMETESVCKAFPMLLAYELQADAIVIAHSGMGVERNYKTKYPGWTMPKRYTSTLDMDSTLTYRWDAAKAPFHPNITIILLGGNDFSVGVTPDREDFAAAYMTMLRQIKHNYGEAHPILCAVRSNDTELTNYVEQVVAQCGMEAVAFLALDQKEYMPDGTFRGANKHPNDRAHARIANTLLTPIRMLMGEQ